MEKCRICDKEIKERYLKERHPYPQENVITYLCLSCARLKIIFKEAIKESLKEYKEEQ